MKNQERIARYLLLFLAVMFATLLALARARSVAVPPASLAAVALLAAMVALARLGSIVTAWIGGKSRSWSARGEALFLAGLATAVSGGFANWARGVQGYIVLQEGEAVPFSDGKHLQGFTAGPFAPMAETHLAVRLDEVKLEPGPGGVPAARSRITIEPEGERPYSREVTTASPAGVGSLLLAQGAFGFAPRLVVVKDQHTLFDRVVPFYSRRGATPAITFDGEIRLPSEEMIVAAHVTLEGLDERMRGHPRLAVEVKRRGEIVGAGELEPGHFAALEGGVRVGFAGMKMWSEIDLRRRTYRGLVLGSVASLALGAVLWGLAAWRRW